MQQYHAAAKASDNNAIYRVVNNRNRNVAKSEAAMQTETVNAAGRQIQTASTAAGPAAAVDWKQAMAHNARVLSSQEKAMDEYLKRQRAAAEQHIAAANSQLQIQQRHQTPEQHQPRMNFIRGGSLEKQFVADGRGLRSNRESRGGSLERKFTAAGGWSDSEYGRMLGSPMASRRNNNSNAGSSNSGSSPNSPNSPACGKRDPAFGSRSLPKGTSSLNYGLMLDKLQQKRQLRQQQQHKNDGSMSDSTYATYGELKQRSPYSWLQPASTYAASLQQENFGLYGRIGEGHEAPSTAASIDPMGSSESLTSVTSSIQQARANSLTKARLMMHQRSLSPRSSLKRGGAMSETSYGGDTSTAAGSDTEYYGIPHLLQRENSASVIARFKSSPPTGTGVNATQVPSPTKPHGKIYGPGLGLASASPIYQSGQEARTDAEIAALKSELLDEHRKVASLTTQLATNAQVVSAFEQSLANMTSRLHDLTMTAEKKDSELSELRRTIDLLRQSGADAGLIRLSRHKSTDSVNSAVSESGDEGADGSGVAGRKGKKKKSSLGEEGGPKRSGWLRHSFSRAFSRSNSTSEGNKAATKTGKVGNSGSVSDVEGDSMTNRMCRIQEAQSLATTASGKASGKGSQIPRQQQPPEPPVRSSSAASGSVAFQQHPAIDAVQAAEIVGELQRQLLEKESLLTETRLEALSSAHQVSLKQSYML